MTNLVSSDANTAKTPSSTTLCATRCGTPDHWGLDSPDRRRVARRQTAWERETPGPGDFDHVESSVDATIDASASSICANQSPSQGSAQYNITLTSATLNDYTLQAAKAAGNGCDGGGYQLTADGTQTEI